MWFKFVIIIFLFYPCEIKSIISFTSDGFWSNTSSHCAERYLCKPATNLTWVQSTYPLLKYYGSISGCNALVKKGIKIIYFHGDSYMRQIYAALLITLRGDYKYGSLANSSATPQCAYHLQFNEKKCSLLQLDHEGFVCDGRIQLEPFLNNFETTKDCHSTNGSVVLWSVGNHKCTRYGRTGVNNATERQGCFEKNICKDLKNHVSDGKYSSKIMPNGTCSVWWVSTHHRVRGYFEDEAPERVKGFNDGMREYFDRGRCGEVNYIDVFNMTSRLVNEHNADALTMTYDNVHWGMEVNLIKAQIVLNALLTDESVVQSMV
jgi:hypothetical protein